LWCLTSFSTIFSVIISWQSVLLVEETGENHPPVASHWQTLSQVLSNVNNCPIGGRNRHVYEIDIYLVNVIPVYYFRVSGIKLHCFMNQHWDYSQPLNQLSRDWSQSSVKLLHRSLLPCQQINIFAIFLKLIVIIYFVLITQKSCFSLLKCVFLRFFYIRQIVQDMRMIIIYLKSRY
jgi:hypothetical protein